MIGMVLGMVKMGMYLAGNQVYNRNLHIAGFIRSKGTRKKKNCYDDFGDFWRYRKGFRLLKTDGSGSPIFFLIKINKFI